MKEYGEFIAQKIEKTKTPEEYEWEEFRKALSLFKGSEREILEKAFSGYALSKSETGTLNKCRDEWWYESYGFPYSMHKQRRMTLRNKYRPPEERIEAKHLQDQLIAAYKEKNDPEKEKLRMLYQERYPDQLEGVAALLDFASFLETEQALDRLRKESQGFSKEMGILLEQLTQYQFLITDFIAQNSSDKEFLNRFWGVLQEIASDMDTLRNFLKMRRGILGQVAAMKILEEIGEHPKLAHPKEDAFRSIDAWLDTSHVVQVKGYMGSDPALLETDAISFPAVVTEKNKKVRYASSHLASEMNRFQAKVSKYKEIIGKKDLKGYLMVVPFGQFDAVTGQPNEEVVTFFKDKFLNTL